ncbi:MAG: hypothetical protein J5662_03415 [Clostridia bacterium]|nr:hypothetical protein [Clostridia bacterium]
MSLESKVQSLITAANAVTGESRTDLTACVQDLKDGYGGGGNDCYLTNYSDETTIAINSTDKVSKQSNMRIADLKKDSSNFVFNPATATKSVRIIIRAKLPQASSNRYPYLFGTSTYHAGIFCFFFPNGNIRLNYTSSNSLDFSISEISSIYNNWTYYVVYCDVENLTVHFSVYDDTKQLIAHKSTTFTALPSNTAAQRLGGETYSDNIMYGSFDLNNVVFEKDGVVEWGNLNPSLANLGIFTD